MYILWFFFFLFPCWPFKKDIYFFMHVPQDASGGQRTPCRIHFSPPWHECQFFRFGSKWFFLRSHLTGPHFSFSIFQRAKSWQSTTYPCTKLATGAEQQKHRDILTPNRGERQNNFTGSFSDFYMTQANSRPAIPCCGAETGGFWKPAGQPSELNLWVLQVQGVAISKTKIERGWIDGSVVKLLLQRGPRFSS